MRRNIVSGYQRAVCQFAVLCFQTNLDVDYDPRNISHHGKHMCMDERKLYDPSYEVKPKLLDYTIPPEYSVSIAWELGYLCWQTFKYGTK